MFRSWRLGRIFQIETSIHWSFWLLILWILLSVSSSGGLSQGLAAVEFLIAVFVCVYLHELGHAFAAKHYGIRTLDITMLPIGGLARLERMPDKPIQELWIALAGPAVNIVIALALGTGLVLRGELAQLRDMAVLRHNFLEQLVVVNLSLAVFNMFPALPMDGGRVLRSLLQLRLTRLRATEIAAKISRYLAFFLIAIGLLKGMFTLVLIGIFVLVSGFQELMMVRFQAWQEANGDVGGSGGPFPGSSGFWIQSNFEFRTPNSHGRYESTTGQPLSRDSDILDAEDVKRIK